MSSRRRRHTSADHLKSIIVACMFFFFQAEDGIRDLTVTGVQTCALPISKSGDLKLRAEVGELEKLLAHLDAGGALRDYRSEERRVGKEGRSRWSPYH